jgi:hypothetical protein
MPSVICPSCDRVTYAAAAYRALDLCRHCGEVLPLRRSVVTVMAHTRRAGDRRERTEPLRRRDS